MRRARPRAVRIRSVPLLAIAFSLTFVACGKDDQPDAFSAGVIDGVVLLGPMCPVENVASPCPDRPLPRAHVMVHHTGGGLVTVVKTDRNGRFLLQIDPGDYTLLIDTGDDPSRTSKAVDVHVQDGRTTSVIVPVDSGIR